MSLPRLACIVLLALPASASAQQAIFLVRHADRDSSVPDGLTDAGRTRAQALADTLKHAGLTVLVRSDTRRTRETALPLLRAGNLPERVSPADRNHVERAFEAIRAAGPRAVVLYVGHSDTIGPLLARLGYPGQVTVGDKEYGNLFVLVPRESGPPTLLRLHYGAKE